MACELLSPAGDFDTALAAFAAGADAVYCGLGEFSARAYAVNFSAEDLRALVRYARANGRKVYVTVNTLLDESQMDDVIATLGTLADIGPDALIVQDIGVARLCRRHFPSLALHASTQMVAHNLEGVLALKELGFTRVVLARELSLAEIASIAKRCGETELEVFVHGALCYSVSGLCLFGAVEKGRSGNRGACPYCCRQTYADAEGHKALAFSMKDLRVGEDARRLAEAGVASLKIEGRMKSALYVASVTKYYRQILDGVRGLTPADLETVFSRRTTQLYLNGQPPEGVIDPTSLGHLGTPVGTVKRLTKDREGRRWLRFHTLRALEKHDGLQFANPDGGKPLGFGIGEMRPAISRVPVFEVAAGTDVEIALPETEDLPIQAGDTVYCSMSNAVKRMFPAPAYRESDYPGTIALDLALTLAPDRVTVRANGWDGASASAEGTFAPAKNPEKTRAAAEAAFAKLGGTDYRLGTLALEDPGRLFVPARMLNDLRRDLVERLDEQRARQRVQSVDAARADEAGAPSVGPVPMRTVRLRVDQSVPPGDWDEVVVVIGAATDEAQVAALGVPAEKIRLGLPVYTAEPAFNRLRSAVKRFLRAGYAKWEASDLATLRMLKALGVTDLTGDWTLYAFNASALAAWTELGVARFVASPENGRDNAQFLSESGYAVAFLTQQATPLFVSLTAPALAQPEGLSVYRRGDLWITTRPVPRTFAPPSGAAVRVDLSWDPPL